MYSPRQHAGATFRDTAVLWGLVEHSRPPDARRMSPARARMGTASAAALVSETSRYELDRALTWTVCSWVLLERLRWFQSCHPGLRVIRPAVPTLVSASTGRLSTAGIWEQGQSVYNPSGYSRTSASIATACNPSYASRKGRVRRFPGACCPLTHLPLRGAPLPSSIVHPHTPRRAACPGAVQVDLDDTLVSPSCRLRFLRRSPLLAPLVGPRGVYAGVCR